MPYVGGWYPIIVEIISTYQNIIYHNIINKGMCSIPLFKNIYRLRENKYGLQTKTETKNTHQEYKRKTTEQQKH